ncbi:retrovirus-related Pol polyprotein from transposon TNT 1-94 [Trichonephila clavata]|uniref:Retrovirus-related Pol polyprotein from transposon TNT 1-94 n=1 Tax=Trichonephila clavata TaxID=2740835 RepID=A0A8X6GNM9_TRICU|nr:retrovirus-related Pol polyprotein from transposon TNT 1-94 [Trichonephila clavata]
MDMNKEIATQSTRMESKKRSIKTCYQCKSPDHLKNNCQELTSRRTTMNNSYRSPRRHFTPRNVKGSYQHGKRCQSPTRQRQSRNNQRRSNQTPNKRNNFHHRDVSPEAGKYSNFITTSLNIVDESAEWVSDTAASHHFCRNRDYFDEFYPTTNEEMSAAIEGVNTPIEGRGTVNLKFGSMTIILTNVIYSHSPKLRNLISGPQLDKKESIPFQKPHSGVVLEPVYLKFEQFEPFPDEDSRHERIVKDASDKSSVATPESSEDETDEDSPDTHKPSTKTVNWFRKLVPRPDGSRTDVYYYQEGCTKRLRTLKDIEKYCKDHNLTFDSDIFNFSQSDTFHGVIDGSKGVASSSLSRT